MTVYLTELRPALVGLIDSAMTLHLHNGDPGALANTNGRAMEVSGASYAPIAIAAYSRASGSGTNGDDDAATWTISSDTSYVRATIVDDVDFGDPGESWMGVSWWSLRRGANLADLTTTPGTAIASGEFATTFTVTEQTTNVTVDGGTVSITLTG